MAGEGVACHCEAAEAGTVLGRTCQVLGCTQRGVISDISVGRDCQDLARPSFPRVPKTLWYHESSQIYQPLISLHGDVK